MTDKYEKLRNYLNRTIDHLLIMENDHETINTLNLYIGLLNKLPIITKNDMVDYYFIKDVEHILQRANQCAQLLNHEYIGTEHLLMAYAEHKQQIGNLTGQQIIEEIKRQCPSGESCVTMGRLPYTPSAKVVKEAMIAQCRKEKACGATMTHLFGALMQDPTGFPRKVLRSLDFWPLTGEV